MGRILSITEIQELIPHRYPFLMIDRVELGQPSTEIKAVKNVTTNEVHFVGHFPDNPIMPGVLQVESVLQAGIIAFKINTGTRRNDLIIIKAVKRARFKSPIIPGDQVIIEAKIDNITDDSCEVKASCRVAGVLKSQSHLLIGYLDDNDLIPTKLTTEFSKDGFSDIGAQAIFTVHDIAKYIPHRFPFQFIDKVIFNEDNIIIGEKLVSANEPFSISYTPESPFMPNTMLLETMAQLGCVKLLSQPKYSGKIGLFLSIEDAVIKRPAIPGDKLTFSVSFLFFRGLMGKARGSVLCGNEEIATMTIAFALAEPEV